MSKKQQRKSGNNPQPGKASAAASKSAPSEFLFNIKLQGWLIFTLAFLLYANALKHGFVYDDGIVISENMYTQEGIKGFGGILSHDTFYGFFKKEGMETLVSGGRYRPMSLLLFATIYQFVGAKPFLFHLATVLLFAFTCMLLHRVLLKLLIPTEGQAKNQNSYMVAFLATMLFAVHPIHTEAVANIKGCDEILALLGSLGALYFTLKAWDSRQQKYAIFAGLAFFAACLSKENAVAYAVLIPLALWFFRPAEAGAASTSIWRSSLPVFIGLVLFLVIRGSILPWSSSFGGEATKELMNNPFLKLEGGQWVAFSFSERMATIFYTLWKYIQLLFLPHPLTHDYYPRHIEMMRFANIWVILSLALYAFVAYWIWRGFKTRDPLSYSLLLYLLPLGIVSNLIFPVGVNMSERFLFMPSVGFCLLIALFLVKNLDKNKGTILGVFALVCLLFSIKTISRNAAWESNEQLFMTDVAVSKNSAKLQNACAQIQLDRAKVTAEGLAKTTLCQEALKRVETALKIYPDFKAAIIVRAGAKLELQQYPEAIADYRLALEQAPTNTVRKTMLAFALRDYGKYFGQQKQDLPNAFKYLNESWEVNPEDPETARLLGVANYVQGNREEAVRWYTKAEEVAPDDAGSLWELGLAYGNLGMVEKARALHQKATSIDPKIAQKAALGEPVGQ